MSDNELHTAAKGGDVDAVKKAIENIDDVNAKGENGGTALYWAARNGRLKVVQFLLDCPGVDVDLTDKWLQSPLYTSCWKDHNDVAELLIQRGADVLKCDNGNQSPLYWACRNGDKNVVALLIEKGAEVKKPCNKDGDTPLHIAGQNGRVEAFIFLFNIGADYLIKNMQDKTCFDVMSASTKLAVLTQIELTPAFLEFDNYYMWFVVVQSIQADGATDADVFTKLLAQVTALVLSHPALASAKDAYGRAAVDMASKDMKYIIQSVILWHGRYRITEPRPEHISATCFVFKGVDEHSLDQETGQPLKVALKLMRLNGHFQRELTARDKGFSHEFVMNVLQTHPEVGSSTMNEWPDEVLDVEADATGQLTKINAEKLYLLVMPLADRNLFVALKQERWAGENMGEVRHVFAQLVHCVEHMHEKGVLHADIKTLNIVRTVGQWKLIDLDAACEIGKEPVGQKSSSAYVPPEAIYVDEMSDTACVRSALAVTKGEANYDLLTAHPSFDVWSLGCILYQMCTTDVKPLFQGGQDDNLVGVRKGVDNLFALAEWSLELKADKLADVTNKLARNLLSLMLHKDPLQRPTLTRVLAHPFLSGKKVARLIGEKPKYDVFISYRVASDSPLVKKLYSLLTAMGLKVYWDKLCLEPGVDWEQGFCEGLVSSRAFVPLLSRDAINHPDKAWQNFSRLTPDSHCDNVFLEHRLAVELQELGLIEKIFPVFIGNLDTTTSQYSHYFGSGCHPSLPDVTVKSVEEKLRHHMENQALGTPLYPGRTVKSVVSAICACQGAFIEGPADETFTAAANGIAKMLTDNVCVTSQSSPRGGTLVQKALLGAQKALLGTIDIRTLLAENSALKGEIGSLKGDNDSLKGENVALTSDNDSLRGRQETALASLTSDEFASAEAVIAHMQALLQG